MDYAIHRLASNYITTMVGPKQPDLEIMSILQKAHTPIVRVLNVCNCHATAHCGPVFDVMCLFMMYVCRSYQLMVAQCYL